MTKSKNYTFILFILTWQNKGQIEGYPPSNPFLPVDKSYMQERGKAFRSDILNGSSGLMGILRETLQMLLSLQQEEECAHWCVSEPWPVGCCRCCWCCAWRRRWRCCTAGRAGGLSWCGTTAASPACLFLDCSSPAEHTWPRSRWSGCAPARAGPSVAPPRSPPRAAHGDQREAAGLGTVATLHVKFIHSIIT